MTDKLDLLITNGRILDGTGNPGYEADIGIVGAEIARMGREISLIARLIGSDNDQPADLN